MPFTDISLIEIILNSVAFIVIFVFGLAVYLKNPKSHTNILFFLLKYFACKSNNYQNTSLKTIQYSVNPKSRKTTILDE